MASGPGEGLKMLNPIELLALQNISLTKAKKTILSEINLSIRTGERIAIIGPNGAGKSSLLRVLAQSSPFMGQRKAMINLRLAMVFQKPYVMRFHLQTQIALSLWWRGVSWILAKKKALLALEKVGLLDHCHQSGRSLSGGQQQRLALARAWISEPQLWLLDEPTASLDSHSKREIEQLMLDFSTYPQTSLVLVSHQLSQVKKLATRVIFVDKGKIILDLSHADFFNVQLWSSFPLPVQDLLNEEYIT